MGSFGGLGSFVSGLQSGYGFTQDAKRNRQREKMYDQALESGAMDLDKRRHFRMDEGLDPLEYDSLGDDPLQRWMKKGFAKVKGALGGQPAAAGIPTAAPPMQQGSAVYTNPLVDPPEYEPQQFAMGGQVQPWQPQPQQPMGIPMGGGGMGGIQQPPSSGMPGVQSFAPPMRAGVGGLGVQQPGSMRFAGGGQVESPAEIAKRLAEEGKRPAGKPMDAEVKARRASAAEGPRPASPKPQYAEGDPSKYGPAQKGQTGNAARSGAGGKPAPRTFGRYSGAMNSGKLGGVEPGQGWAERTGRRVVGGLKGTVAGAAAAAAGAGAMEGYGRDTQEYADQLGMEPGEGGFGGFLKDAFVIRPMGVMQDVGRAMIPDAAEPYLGIDPWESDKQDAAPPEGAPTDPARPSSAPPAAAPEQASPASGIPPVKQKEQAAQPAEQPQQEFVDTQNMEMADIPDMGVQDWVAYRKQTRQTAARSGRMEDVQAADAYVDDQQHRGFLHYGNIALQMLQNGDEEGAAKSMMMAYQYFPNGSHLRFGTQNGKLIAVGVGEDGQPKGAQALDVKSLAGQLANFQKPENFKAWTLDWRAQELQEKAEGRMQQQTDQQGDYQEGLLNIGQQNAQSQRISAGADVIRAGAAGAGGGLKPDTVGSAENMFLQMIDRESMTHPELQDPENARLVASVMSRVYAQNGGRLNPQDVVQLVLSEYKGMQGGGGG